MAEDLIVVKVAHDADAGVPFIEWSDLPGVNLEGATLEERSDKLPGAILDLLKAPGLPIATLAHPTH